MELNSILSAAEEISTGLMSEEMSSGVLSEMASNISPETADKSFMGIAEFASEFAQGTIDFAGKITSPDPDSIMHVLEVMGMGMLGIFGVTAIIILVVTLLNKSGSKPKKDKEDK